MPVARNLFKTFSLGLFIMSVPGLLSINLCTAASVVTKDHYFRSFDGKTIFIKEKSGVEESSFRGAVVCFPPCIYSHHFFDCPVSDCSLMDDLAEQGFRVFAYDPRGFGSSYQPPDGRSITYEVELRDAEALVNFVLNETDAKTVSLVAFGSGAQVACGYALRHPERVNALALMDFVWRVFPEPLSPQFKEMLLSQPKGYLQLSHVEGFFAPLLRFTSPEIMAWVKSTFIVAPVGPLLTAFESMPLIKPASDIRAPVLILRGTQAGITSESDTFDFLSKVSSQIRVFDALEGAGPIPTLEKGNYRRVLRDIRWFLGRR